MADLSIILNQVKELAKRVGEFQREQRKTFVLDRVEAKRSHDYVSYVDKESEKMIVERLREILPEAGFITEEKTVEQKDENAELFWVVDPLDGTTNFIHDLGPWCVCIALRSKDELLVGVVYEITRGELFYASKGCGAWLLADSETEPKPLKVAGTTDLDQSLIMVGFPYDADAWREFCSSLTGGLHGHCASIRSYGSAEGELCYVAAGRIDVYIESYIQPWDVAAGALILLEAGGRISDYDGKDEQWECGHQVLATNGNVHEQMLAEVQKRIHLLKR